MSKGKEFPPRQWFYKNNKGDWYWCDGDTGPVEYLANDEHIALRAKDLSRIVELEKTLKATQDMLVEWDGDIEQVQNELTAARENSKNLLVVIEGNRERENQFHAEWAEKVRRLREMLGKCAEHALRETNGKCEYERDTYGLILDIARQGMKEIE